MTKKLVAAAAGVFALVLAAGTPAGAQDKCSGGKLKAAGKALQGGIKCDAKAQAKATAGGGAACEAKPDGKLTTAFSKADAKGPCGGSASAVAAANETCETNVIAAVGNNDATPVASKCDSKKSAAMGKKASAKLSCLSKQASKGTDPTACLAAAEGKFSAAIGKLSAATDCSNASTAGTLETVVNNCVSAVSALIGGGGTTTTTIGGTTTTTLCSPTGTSLKYTTTAGTTSCGSGGLGTGPSAPFTGEIDTDTACSVLDRNLGASCLYIGGGSAVTVPPGATPAHATSFLNICPGNALVASNGTGGLDCTKGASLTKHCINMNPPLTSCTMDTPCPSSTSGSCQADANCTFGPPLAIINGGLSTCVINVVATDASGTFVPGTGVVNLNLPLRSDVYVTGNMASPCPQCNCGAPPCSGTGVTGCTAGPNVGMACSTTATTGDPATTNTTHDCPPDEGLAFAGALSLGLYTLTTGSTSLTAASGLFCGSAHAGAFGRTTAKCITQTGSPAGDLTIAGTHAATEASEFCIPATTNGLVNVSADLPGPGATSLPGLASIVPTP